MLLLWYSYTVYTVISVHISTKLITYSSMRFAIKYVYGGVWKLIISVVNSLLSRYWLWTCDIFGWELGTDVTYPSECLRMISYSAIGETKESYGDVSNDAFPYTDRENSCAFGSSERNGMVWRGQSSSIYSSINRKGLIDITLPSFNLENTVLSVQPIFSQCKAL